MCYITILEYIHSIFFNVHFSIIFPLEMIQFYIASIQAFSWMVAPFIVLNLASNPAYDWHSSTCTRRIYASSGKVHGPHKLCFRSWPSTNLFNKADLASYLEPQNPFSVLQLLRIFFSNLSINRLLLNMAC